METIKPLTHLQLWVYLVRKQDVDRSNKPQAVTGIPDDGVHQVPVNGWHLHCRIMSSGLVKELHRGVGRNPESIHGFTTDALHKTLYYMECDDLASILQEHLLAVQSMQESAPEPISGFVSGIGVSGGFEHWGRWQAHLTALIELLTHADNYWYAALYWVSQGGSP